MYNLFNLLYFPNALPTERSDLKVLPSGICEYVEANDSGIDWIVVTNAQLIKNTAHRVDSLTLTNLVLPSTNLSLGDRVIIVDEGTGGFQINQSAGEQIRYGDKQTTLGIAGRIISIEVGSVIELIFLGSKWLVGPGTIGNFEVS